MLMLRKPSRAPATMKATTISSPPVPSLIAQFHFPR